MYSLCYINYPMYLMYKVKYIGLILIKTRCFGFHETLVISWITGDVLSESLISSRKSRPFFRISCSCRVLQPFQYLPKTRNRIFFAPISTANKYHSLIKLMNETASNNRASVSKECFRGFAMICYDLLWCL